ncbi:hypothetical protein ABT272_44065 [Streptomyces sp900105245]|uniref:Lipoprotein n=1 Tax=Streptomyces sp. 900105245 TaxID=3154379 RepID=A0ABV1ULA5_9ACTN
MRKSATFFAVGAALIAVSCNSSKPKEPPPADAYRAVATSDFALTCARGQEYGNLPPFKREAGTVPPTALLTEFTSGWTEQPTSGKHPQGWIVKYGQRVEKVQLVACAQRIKGTSTAKTCTAKQFVGNATKAVNARLYDATYKVKIREARTGKIIAERTMHAASTDCAKRVLTERDGSPPKYYAAIADADYVDLLQSLLSSKG